MSNEASIIGLSEKELLRLSEEKLLSLNVAEMSAIQDHFEKAGRNPTEAELETLAQTWSEHCKHKVFNSVVEFEEGQHRETIESLFTEYIVTATQKAMEKKKGFFLSVFTDNAGIVSFDGKNAVAFKAETHNHPSALDPYGGANTGIGGVVRDVLGAGLGAKPVANTDVFCFAEPWTPSTGVPEGAIHPKRTFKGVRFGVRDYGNRIGVPTVNGAICFDKRYIANPLVFCGTVGLIPENMVEKNVHKGELIVVVGARTGKDGIHGATFSSTGLKETSPATAVQIGNAIEEKKIIDLVLRARDRRLFTCITDCGAGGFSSAIGEMAKNTGAIVNLEKAPLKQKGLSPWEIWVSESQERMVLSVHASKLAELVKLAAIEEVEIAVLGQFTSTKKLEVYYGTEKIIDLPMNFLHSGLPKQRRKAVYTKPRYLEPDFGQPPKLGKDLCTLLAMPNIASKETTIRQYDHEVQGTSILKPLVGEENDGPSDAAIVRPDLESWAGVAISNGINPWIGDIDPYLMAGSCIDEAIRNLVATGTDPDKIALLDNFSWGNPDKPVKMGELVKAVKGCHDFAVDFETGFISGKDSFYNEYSRGELYISIPSTLLISAIGIMSDCRKKVSMDLKENHDPLYIVGETFSELGASHYFASRGFKGNRAPSLDAKKALAAYRALHKAMSIGTSNSERLVRSCHDLSEGGLCVAIAEMCFAGMKGAKIDLAKIPLGEPIDRDDFILFSESNSRLLVEVNEKHADSFEQLMEGNAFAKIGEVTQDKNLEIKGLKGKTVVNENIGKLKKTWKKTLDW
ncbi:MAG: phosphoribosylformylglycinamidine synthase subunit PurL [Candidatus Diapherotrites archaeon]|nr:phosphoribosylformylglycinamidine synthase subunit PurL [Candidatus Diapherotrites archaeon]